MFVILHNVPAVRVHTGLIGLQSYQCWTDGSEDVKFFSGAAEAAAALTSDKVTPAAVAEVFTIWITGIIPLLFDSVVT